MLVKGNPAILTVDDDASVRISIKNYLEDYGFKLFQADNGEKCLDIIDTEKIDLVLLDLKMPGMDGLEVLSRIKNLKPNLPVIVISGTGEIEDVILALRNGAQNFLQKPISNLEVLSFAVNSAIEKARLKRENQHYQNHLEELVDSKVKELNQTYEKLIKEVQNRANAEDQLKESQVLLDSVMRTIPDIIYRIDVNGRFLFINEAIKRYGYSPSELIGESVLEIVHPEDRTLVQERLSQRKDGNLLIPNIELRFLSKQKEVFNFQVHVSLVTKTGNSIEYQESPLIFKNDPIIATQGIALDITERVKAEKALKESEERYRIIIENSHSGILVVDDEFKITFCNPKFKETLARSEDEIIGHDFREFVSEETLDRVITNYKLRQNENSAAEKMYEFEIVRKDGSRRSVEIFSNVIQTSEQRKVTIAQILDITERKIAEKELIVSEKRFRQLFEDAPYGVFVYNDGGLLIVNPEFTNLFEYSEEELIKQTIQISDLIEEDSNSLVTDSKKTFKSYYGIGTTRLGNKIEIEVKKDKIDWDGQKAVLGFIRDLTEQKKLEEQFQQAQKMEAIGRLAGGIAHDFNNLLTVISGNADLVMMGMDKNNILYKDVEEIVATAERASNLTRQLLAFSRKQDFKPQMIEINRLISGLNSMLKRIIGEDISLKTEFCDRELWLKNDQSQLEQIIVNIVVNARDAMPNGGELLIRTKGVHKDTIPENRQRDLHHNRYVEIQIKDSGIGMSGDVINHIFEPFYTTKELGSGTGLGLATVFGIVKQSKGKIAVNSAEGAGTTFSIFLPLTTNEVDTARKEVKDAKNFSGTETIFIVEDDLILLKTINKSLTRFGYKTITATSAEDALDQLKNMKEKVDLFISDIIMSGMNGRDLVNVIRENDPDIRVLFMSGYSENLVESTTNDLNDYIAKPFNMKELMNKVKTCLRQ